MKVLASLTAVLVLASAGAASAGQARVAFSDLNLATAAGAATLDQRIEVAARDLCRRAHRPVSRILDRESCKVAVRAEVLRQLPAAAQADYAASRAAVAY